MSFLVEVSLMDSWDVLLGTRSEFGLGGEGHFQPLIRRTCLDTFFAVHARIQIQTQLLEATESHIEDEF